MKRENFQSRLGFLLVSAGCAIGIGNVWKFPYVTGAYGGGVFVLFYLAAASALLQIAASCMLGRRSAALQ